VSFGITILIDNHNNYNVEYIDIIRKWYLRYSSAIIQISTF
jgi:hypothetical protein